MIERIEIAVGATSVPVIPYDSYVAATLFLATGRTAGEVLPLLGLTSDEWKRLGRAYNEFAVDGASLWTELYFPGLSEAEIYQLIAPPRWKPPVTATPDLRDTRRILNAVRRAPHIGPFAHCDWPMTWIAAHPVAKLLSYTHDGSTVYFGGKPLADRKGVPLEVDVESFAVVDGRWLRDANRIYGQGEGRTTYWYVVEGADYESFEALNLRYARDKAQAYYITGKTIRTKSPEAFEIVPELRLNYRDITRQLIYDHSYFARDRNGVYFYGDRLRGARPEAFRDLGHDYVTDGRNVWYLASGKKQIEGADAASFIVPGPEDRRIPMRDSSIPVTDRFRPYRDGAPCDPALCFDDWRPFFESRTDLAGWWWHEIERKDRERS